MTDANRSPLERALLLGDERDLEQAESTLELWAHQLAEAGRDRDAAEALRVAGAILRFRSDFLQSEKHR